MQMHQKEWFKNWFNTHYYHILYNHRDYKEAEHFIDNLLNKIHLSAKSKILDAPCGKGRHAIYLNKLGYDVTGLDISESSIEHAVQFENNLLSFFVHDIREPFRINYFDAVFNLFTSFGYFEIEESNKKCLKNYYHSLKPGGYFVIDFFNTHKVLRNFKDNYKVSKDGLNFNITKKIEDQFIIKNIEINDNGIIHHYMEKVQLLSKSKLIGWIEEAGFVAESVFGNYELNDFDNDNSERCIIFAKKPME